MKATQFIADNFSSVQYVGSGPYSVVFKANSRQFHARQETYAVKVVLSADNLTEGDISRVFQFE